MVPNGWSLITFDELLTESNQGINTTTEKVIYSEAGVPAIRSNNVDEGKFDLRDEKFVSSDEYSRFSHKFKPNTDDILYCNIGSNLGAACVNNLNIPFLITWNVFRAVPNKKLLNPQFGAMQLNFKRKDLRRYATESTMPFISSKVLLKYKFLTPPLPEQRKIAKILSTWDKAISTTEGLIGNSKQQKKALMQQLLTGKKRLLDDSGKSYDSEWRFSTFSELFKVANNKKTQVKSSEYLSEGKTPIVDQGKQLISGYTNNDEKYTELPVIIFGDHTRVVKWVNFAFAQGADGTQVLKSTKLLNDKYAYYLLSDTDIPNLGYSRHMRELKEKDFKYPTDTREQERIASVLTNADKEIDLLEQQLADLKQEKKALMQQLLTGKRRVKIDDKEVT